MLIRRAARARALGCVLVPAAILAGLPVRADSATQKQPAGEPLAQQRQVADRFRQLKQALIRMSDLSTPADGRRAALVKQAVAQSNDLEIERKFEKLAELMEKKQFSTAFKDQGALLEDLKRLLEVLLSEDRIRRLETEKQRLRVYIKQINKFINEQRSLEDQASRNLDPKELSGQQADLAQRTGKLAREIKKSEGTEDSKSGKTSPPQQADRPGGDERKKPQDDARDKDKSRPKDSAENGEPGSRPAQPGQQPDGKPKPGQQGKPQQGSPQQSQSGESQPGESQPSQQPPGHDRLQKAQNRMQQAEQNLKNSKRDPAIERQQQALTELEQAKAELEEVLRQLREEEIGRTLAMLEARFRKMLEMQTQVYDGTRRLDKNVSADPDAGRQRDIESGRLSRTEAEIVSQADRALALLREEGSAVAFPEAVVEIRDDMEQVVIRLAQAKVDKITQGVERDIMAALEEMLAALQKAQKDLDKKKQMPPMAMDGDSPEPPLVDTLSELKIIRAMQVRVNRRTQEYAKMTRSEQADQPELLSALERLAEREARIHRITRDIVVGRNR